MCLHVPGPLRQRQTIVIAVVAAGLRLTVSGVVEQCAHGGTLFPAMFQYSQKRERTVSCPRFYNQYFQYFYCIALIAFVMLSAGAASMITYFTLPLSIS